MNPFAYYRTDDVQKDTEHIIESAQKYVFQAVGTVFIFRNWLIGRRIAEEELQGLIVQSMGRP